jgi:hypothetical protein
MAVKILVTAIGQQIVSDVQQVENKETKEIVGYWLNTPRVVQYHQDEEGQISVNFGKYCLLSDEASFSVRADHIVAILEPRDDVKERYEEITAPVGTEVSDETVEELKNATESDSTEGTESDANSAD